MFERLSVVAPAACRAKWVAAAVAAAGLVLAGQAHADYLLAGGDPEAGQANSNTCAACHGSNGNSANPEWPSLAGQHAIYTFRQLQAYQDGDRQNALMTGQVQGLSEQDMRDLAAFYAEQELEPLAAGDGDLSLGERIYRGGNAETGVTACIACHGPRGLGNPLTNYPRVSGQHARYLRDTLREYRSGDRRSDGQMAQMMRDIAGRMSDDEIDAVSAFMQGLQ